MAEIRLITFDLDNTLWDVGQVIRHAEQAMNAWLDEVVPEYRQRTTPDTLKDIREQVVARNPALGHDVSALREAVLYEGMRRLGLTETAARAHAQDAFLTFYEARQQVEFFEHALEALTHLAENYQLAALTNGNAHVEKIGLDRYFSFAFSSADVSASKPAPDIFHAALDRAGVQAIESIHIGDHLVDDIHGAGSVGMHTIWVNRTGAGDRSVQSAEIHTQPTQVVDCLSQLPDAVRRIHDG
jgi:putative hydrolase of the HAD superfamily